MMKVILPNRKETLETQTILAVASNYLKFGLAKWKRIPIISCVLSWKWISFDVYCALVYYNQQNQKRVQVYYKNGLLEHHGGHQCTTEYCTDRKQTFTMNIRIVPFEILRMKKLNSLCKASFLFFCVWKWWRHILGRSSSSAASQFGRRFSLALLHLKDGQ